MFKNTQIEFPVDMDVRLRAESEDIHIRFRTESESDILMVVTKKEAENLFNQLRVVLNDR